MKTITDLVRFFTGLVKNISEKIAIIYTFKIEVQF